MPGIEAIRMEGFENCRNQRDILCNLHISQNHRENMHNIITVVHQNSFQVLLLWHIH